MRWSRHYRVAHVGRHSLRLGARRQVLRLGSAGSIEPAYRLAIGLARHHARRGQQLDAMAMEDVVSSLALRVPYRRGRPVEALALAARRAVVNEDWPLALEYTDAILTLNVENIDERGRALRNRATALHTLGRFSEAVDAYDQLIGDGDVWDRMAPEYQAGVKLSRAAMLWYLQRPVAPQDLEDMTRFLGYAPATWMNYWWVLGHLAWRTRPDRASAIRRGSLRSFGIEWPMAFDRALWGLDLLVAPYETWNNVRQRVRLALDDPTTVRYIGRSGWLDLSADWLFAHLERGMPGALTQVYEHAVWCAERGYDGWAAYWQSLLATYPPIPAQELSRISGRNQSNRLQPPRH